MSNTEQDAMLPHEEFTRDQYVPSPTGPTGPMKPFADTWEIQRWLAEISHDPITHSDVGIFSCYAYGTRGKVLPFANKCEFWSAL